MREDPLEFARLHNAKMAKLFMEKFNRLDAETEPQVTAFKINKICVWLAERGETSRLKRILKDAEKEKEWAE